jgi:hypothetical protein
MAILEQIQVREKGASAYYANKLCRTLSRGKAEIIGGQKLTALIDACDHVVEAPNPDWLQLGWEKNGLIFALAFAAHPGEGTGKDKGVLRVTLDVKSAEGKKIFFEKVLDGVQMVNLVPLEEQDFIIGVWGRGEQILELRTNGGLYYCDPETTISL